MQIKNIQTILAVTILTLILTSNVQATECLKNDENMVVATALNAIFEKTGQPNLIKTAAAERNSSDEAFLVSTNSNADARLQVLSADGYLTAQPVGNLSDLDKVQSGKVLLINKCIAITVGHVTRDLIEKKKILAKSPLSDEESRTLYGSFGETCGPGKNEALHAGIEMKVIAQSRDPGVDKYGNVEELPIEYAVLEINSAKSRLSGISFPKVALSPEAIVEGEPVFRVNSVFDPGHKARYGMRASLLKVGKADRGSDRMGVVSTEFQNDNGNSGGVQWISRDGRLVAHALVRKAGVAIPIRTIFQEIIENEKNKKQEDKIFPKIRALLADSSCGGLRP